MKSHEKERGPLVMKRETKKAEKQKKKPEGKILSQASACRYTNKEEESSSWKADVHRGGRRRKRGSGE